ncbi:glucan 1,3-beta-glucosidase GLUC78 precursor [Moelleriella libera RCEF 2490]|uniref:Glucan 1,3-beta-glucosidase GLUC78 n=1 Tax=Moelleriella libera RCEF 2490 TaxID=1081109 RepID=A0A167YU79_9HYPO|nr:glucan 1,3-beta-glucosidase GLUC78 precursor [Moelleriella libera RCEF 2490]
MGLSTIVSASLLALRLFSLPAVAAPQSGLDAQQGTTPVHAAGSWWLSSIQRQGKPAFGGQDYKVFRNVKDYGARGDGSSDDTAAINRAVSDGQRCGQHCDSSTTTPALVYFPPGTYLVSKPIVQLYYTQLVGDAINVPTLKAASNFEGIAVIDSDPYDNWGNNWWTNQNNFFRQVRNFKIDLTGLPKTTGTGIHWQVAQATSLQNIEFNMVQDKSSANKQQGIFMDNGSGGFMTDLTFNGGAFGAFLGNQQFTTRNLKFNNCKTAIYMNWNWLWTFHGISINNCDIGIDMTSGSDTRQNVGSIVVADSSFSNTPIGITTLYHPGQQGTNGTLILDNVDMRQNVPVAVQNGGNKQTILGGNTLVGSWSQGRAYNGPNAQSAQGARNAVPKPGALTDGSGKIVTRSKPQYENVDASRFVSVKSRGARGDGSTDDTAAIQAVFNSVGGDQIVYFDHGAYVITDTVRVPKDVKVVGEIWPLILAGGNRNFKDMANPKPVFQVGQAGDVGTAELQDLIFETLGPQPGAILMEFNVAGQSKGGAGLWDVHFRVGGSAGTQLQSDKCTKTPNAQTSVNPNCIGAFMLLHLTQSASAYLENTWFWVADHELDLSDHNQINIYNGRGVLIESTKGSWLWGTSSEHSQLYNYQLTNAQNVYMALIQTETAYMQGNPDARVPFTANSKFSDPDFSRCSGSKCARTWGLRVQNSNGVYVYGGGLYSFFDNYTQQCVNANDCQDNIVSVENSRVTMFGISTKASISMVTMNGQAVAKDVDNRNNFCAAIASFESS